MKSMCIHSTREFCGIGKTYNYFFFGATVLFKIDSDLKKKKIWSEKLENYFILYINIKFLNYD